MNKHQQLRHTLSATAARRPLTSCLEHRGPAAAGPAAHHLLAIRAPAHEELFSSRCAGGGGLLHASVQHAAASCAVERGAARNLRIPPPGGLEGGDAAAARAQSFLCAPMMHNSQFAAGARRSGSPVTVDFPSTHVDLLHSALLALAATTAPAAATQASAAVPCHGTWCRSTTANTAGTHARLPTTLVSPIAAPRTKRVTQRGGAAAVQAMQPRAMPAPVQAAATSLPARLLGTCAPRWRHRSTQVKSSSSSAAVSQSGLQARQAARQRSFIITTAAMVGQHMRTRQLQCPSPARLAGQRHRSTFKGRCIKAKLAGQLHQPRRLQGDQQSATRVGHPMWMVSSGCCCIRRTQHASNAKLAGSLVTTSTLMAPRVAR